MIARKLVLLVSLLAAAAAQATPQTDLAALRRLRASAKAGSGLAVTLDDVLAVVPKVEEWVPQTTSGSARERFDAHHKLTGYTVYYQSNSPSEQDRVANMAHELTHAAVNEAHHKDFVNYGNPPDMGKTVPAPVYVQSGAFWALDSANAAARQTAQRNTSAQNALVEKAQALHALIATSGYTTAQQQALSTKALYAASGANSEYDASLTSMLVFCANWGVKTTTPFYKKLDELATEAHLRRAHNARQ